MKGIRFIAIALLGVALPASAGAQALTSLQSLRVGYNTRKATVQPTGELKTQIDEVDRQIAEATRVGKVGEVRRLIAKGQSLLNNQPWTDVRDFSNSVVLRTDRVIADSSKPYVARIEQIYSPTIDLQRSLTAKVELRKRPAAGGGGAAAPGAAPAAPEIAKNLGTFQGVARDLRESPYPLELDVHDVADGTYVLAVDLMDGTRALGTSTLTINLRKGLDDVVAKLEADAKKAPEALKADILFPVDRMRNVNRARLEMRTFDPDRDFAAAEEVAAAVRANKNPFATKTGDFKRHYLLTLANEIMPYRVYVPKAYDGTKAFPLIIALHGLGGTEDSFFDGYNRQFASLAEQHGYIVATPLGYRVDGGYGWGVGNPPQDPIAKQNQERSEADVMQVLQLMQTQYKVDANRTFLMGHSMGAIGTWKIGPKNPDIWAAIAPISGSGDAATLERIKTMPEIIVHGDDDRTVNVSGSRRMVTKLKEMGTEYKYIEVPGGSHSGVVGPNLAAIFDFFDAHPRKH